MKLPKRLVKLRDENAIKCASQWSDPIQATLTKTGYTKAYGDCAEELWPEIEKMIAALRYILRSAPSKRGGGFCEINQPQLYHASKILEAFGAKFGEGRGE